MVPLSEKLLIAYHHSAQVGVKYGGEDIPGSPFLMSSNPDLGDVTSSSPLKKQSNTSGKFNSVVISFIIYILLYF